MKALPARRGLSTLLLVACFITLTGFGCRRATAPTENIATKLVIWGLWQESDMMKPVLDAFEAESGVKVEYKKIASVAAYEKELLEALAQGRGPDLFVIHHTWVENKRGILSAAPADVVDARAVQDEFVDVVAADVVRDGRVYALPTSVDTLALYYNKDILNAAGIPRPPATWTDLQSAVEKITRVNRVGAIEQSAIAMGTAANVNRAPDLFQLLLLQSGLVIEGGTQGKGIATDIGERALTFYTDFANKTKKVYTWDLQQDFSIDAFAEGDTAMMLNYSYHSATVQAKNPRLNFGVAPMPQIADSGSTKINFAAYWPFAVASASPAPQAAWQFLRFLTSHDQAAVVNQAQRTPPARKDSVLDLQRDPILGVFAEGALTARTWPRGDVAATDTIFNRMIDEVVTGTSAPGEALKRADDQLGQLKSSGQ